MKHAIAVTLTLCLFSIGAMFAYDVQGVIPEVAYADLVNDNTFLIDVRTPCEYNWIGHPAVNLFDDPDSGFLEGKVFNIPYLLWQYDAETDAYAMSINEDFVSQVVETFPKDATLYFICRSGGRSAYAQEYLMDPANSSRKEFREIETYIMFNVDEGFEGGRDPDSRHRTLYDVGWKNSNLPYQDGSAGIWTPSYGDDDDDD